MRGRRHDEAFWAAIGQKLEGRSGRQFWRSLEELAETEAFRARIEVEFPDLAPRMDGASRREVLRLMGASLALAGLAGCDVLPPQEAALPYVDAPEFMVPGEPRYYATASLFEGYAVPVLVETHMARPVKVEGNPEHPVSQGASDAFAQAAVLDLYDPDRSASVSHYGREASWSACQLALAERAEALTGRRGRGLAFLSGSITSATTLRQMAQLRERFPRMRWYVHEPVGRERAHAATRLAFGRPQDLHLHLDRADVVVSLDADVIGPGPAQLLHARQWAEGRRARLESRLPGLHVIESTPSLTGAKATQLAPASSPEIVGFAGALGREFGLGDGAAEHLPPPLHAHLSAAAQDLKRAAGDALVLAGAHLAPEVQALALAVNHALGSIGRTIEVSDPVQAAADGTLVDLDQAIEADEVDTLVILDSNPVYTAPADLGFAGLMERVDFRAHLGSHRDETAAHCHWHVPLAHPFESWSDARAVDGTAGVIQPLLRPLYAGRTAHELLATLAGEPQADGRALVRRTWRELLGTGDFESAWRKVLHDGFAEGTAAELRAPDVGAVPAIDALPSAGLEAVIRPDPTTWDGRYANSGWLQELPKPFSKVTWDNVVAISPALAAKRQVADGDLVDVSAGGRRVRAPVWVVPGQAERTLTLYLGYGRERSGRIGDGIGYDAYRLRSSSEPWHLPEVVLETGEDVATLASTQDHHALAGHEELIRAITPEDLRAGQQVTHEENQPSLYPEWDYLDHAWAMAVDLDACIGCNACILACVAENNIPVVGKEQVAIGREMHWLRVDRYYTGLPERPQTHWQPVPCMHCERAPCEVGCPVNATVHGPDGLNQMVYNRCVGTRTCASYCPYKVRRFNYRDYTAEEAPALAALRNPDVTVRSRGVMEKCTYCVQRISAASIEAEKDGRRIEDDAIQTACQQACPTRAIVFGDANDPKSAVSRAKASPRNYALLGELNTRPRTTYLAEVRPARRPKGKGS